MFLNRLQAQKQINLFGSERIPFFFLIDFEETKCQVYPLDQLPDRISYDINGHRNYIPSTTQPETYVFEKFPMPFDAYQKSFDQIMEQLNYGNSFLINLTARTKINCSLSLNEIFQKSSAKYKLLLKDECVSFSPESFIKIEDGILSSYPMKGTIDASIDDAKNQLLSNAKETAEHYTIVDLIRNDLSIYAQNVTVSQFRYIDHVQTNGKNLLQASSKIIGQLRSGYHDQLGDIIFSLLPAGSISGAPKTKTIDIIKRIEEIPRGYYTGIMGIYDGKNLDSGVLIRYIEQEQEQDTKYYRSGGGITYQSNAKDEYQEMIDKVYLPF